MNRIGGGQTLITCCEDDARRPSARAAAGSRPVYGAIRMMYLQPRRRIRSSRRDRAWSASATWTPPPGRTARRGTLARLAQRAGEVDKRRRGRAAAVRSCSARWAAAQEGLAHLSQLNTAALYKRSKASGLEDLCPAALHGRKQYHARILQTRSHRSTMPVGTQVLEGLEAVRLRPGHVHRLHVRRPACTTWCTRSSTTPLTRRWRATAASIEVAIEPGDVIMRQRTTAAASRWIVPGADGQARAGGRVYTVLHAGGKFGGERL